MDDSLSTYVLQGGKIIDSKVAVGSKDSVPEAIQFIQGL